ncbi:MAG: sugar phosphate nucleotidyltransferase [Alphaproteobacteria bacterium]
MRGPPVRQAVIVAGGRGTRLGAIAADTPKPLLDVGGRPFVEHLLFELGRIGIEEVLLLVGPHRAAFTRALRPARRSGPRLALISEPAPAGTAGALWHARRRLAPRFFLLNGDSILDGNLLRLAAAMAEDRAAAGAVAALAVPDSARYGRIACAGDRIEAFREKGAGGPGLVNAGVYLFDRERVLRQVARPPLSLERDVLPALAAEGALRAVRFAGRVIDIGLPDSLAEARELFPAWHRRPGAIVELGALVAAGGAAARTRWQKGAAGALRRLNDAGYYAIVLAPGVARAAALRRRLNAALQREGAHIDALYAARSNSAFDALLESARAEWLIAEAGGLLVTGGPRIVPQTPPNLAVFRARGDLDAVVAAALPAQP